MAAVTSSSVSAPCLVKAVTQKATGSAVTKSITPGQQVVKIVHDELIKTLQGDDAPDALRIDNPRGSSVRIGATEVATVAERGARGAAMAWEAIVNGLPGVVFRSKDGRAFGVVGCTVVDGLIVEIVSVNDRARVLAAGVRDRPPAG